jgi:hypothetical protein
MSVESYRGVVQEGAVVFPEGTATPAEGTEVIVTPVGPKRGTAAAFLAAKASAPPVSAELVKEMLRLIEEGNTPPSYENPFADKAGEKSEAANGEHSA